MHSHPLDCCPRFCPDPKSWLIVKDLDAGKDWGREEKGMTEDEMVGWHHRLNGHEFEKLRELGMDRGAWQATVHGVAKSQTWLSNFTQSWIFFTYSLSESPPPKEMPKKQWPYLLTRCMARNALHYKNVWDTVSYSLRVNDREKVYLKTVKFP